LQVRRGGRTADGKSQYSRKRRRERQALRAVLFVAVETATHKSKANAREFRCDNAKREERCLLAAIDRHDSKEQLQTLPCVRTLCGEGQDGN
jgi:hypothetical protein